MTTRSLRDRMRLRPFDAAGEASLLHAWVTRPYARFWGMQSASLTDVRDAYAAMVASDHQEPLLGLFDGSPAFLCELYDPGRHEVAAHYPARQGDLGMHVLVGPATTPVHGFTLAVMRTVLDRCFADPGVARVVVEPDVRNDRIHRLNAAVGFIPDREVRLSDKRALLSFCTRDDYRRSLT